MGIIREFNKGSMDDLRSLKNSDSGTKDSFIDKKEGFKYNQINARLTDVERFAKLLTSKPVLYICNVSEEDAIEGNEYSKSVQEIANAENALSIIISAKIESEISQLSNEEKSEYLTELGLEQSGLEQVIQSGYKLLDLITYFTSGPEESRAWTVPQGSNAPRAAREIHTDFEKGFIRAEVVSYEDYVYLEGEKKSKEAGKMRVEGKDYIVEDGDVIYFRFNV